MNRNTYRQSARSLCAKQRKRTKKQGRLRSALVTAGLGIGALSTVFASAAVAAPGTAPMAGSVIFNEFNSVNNAVGNDYFELLVIKDGVDLRGLRVTNNEMRSNRLNNGETVYVFDTSPYLESVPKGTTIGVWTSSNGVTTDTIVNPQAGDWKLVLSPGVGVTTSTDGLGGSVRTGLKTEDQLYLYLPGPDGTSAGTDNVYLDFVSWDESNATPPEAAQTPARAFDENVELAAPAGFLTGNDCVGQAVASARNWSLHTSAANSGPSSPGLQNVNQDLNNCRAATVVVPIGDPGVGLGGLALLGSGALVVLIRRRRTTPRIANPSNPTSGSKNSLLSR
jgi:hypothetical protein